MPPKEVRISLAEAMQQAGVGGTSGATAPVKENPDDYLGYMPSGVYSQTNNIENLRGQNQGAGEKWGRFAGNLLFNTAQQLVELPADALSYMTGNPEGVDLNWAKNPFGDLYRSNNDGSVFDPGDLTSWLQTADSLVSSAAAFAIPGGLIARGIGAAARLAGGLKYADLAMKAGNAITAGTMAFMEGAQIGATAARDTYDKQKSLYLSQGRTLEEAEGMAKEDAANVGYRATGLNTVMNTALNMTMFMPFFRNARDIVRGELRSGASALQAGEEMGEYVNRLQGSLQATSATMARDLATAGKRSFIAESLQEGVEELNNSFAEARGREQSHKKSSIWEDLTRIQTWADEAMSAEGAFNFMTGLIGGAGQKMLVDHIPLSNEMTASVKNGSVELGEDGRPKYSMQKVSSARREASGIQAEYTSAVKAIEEDYQTYNNKMTAIRAEKNPQRKAQLMENLFSTNVFQSVERGYGQAWAETYRRIAEADNTQDYSTKLEQQKQTLVTQLEQAPDDQKAPLEQRIQQLDYLIQNNGGQTEAQALGYSTGPDDNAYQEKAKDGIEAIHEATRLLEKMQKKYGSLDQAYGSDYSGYMAHHRFHLDRRAKLLKQAHEELRQSEDSVVLAAGVKGTVTKWLLDHQAQVDKYNQNRTDIQLIRQVSDGTASESELDELVERYDLPPLTEANKVQIVRDLHSQLVETNKSLAGVLQANQTEMETSETDGSASPLAEIKAEYRKWRQLPGNEDLTLHDFIGHSIHSDITLSAVSDDRKQVEIEDQTLKLAEENYRKLDSVKGVTQFMDGVQEYDAKLKAEAGADIRTQNAQTEAAREGAQETRQVQEAAAAQNAQAASRSLQDVIRDLNAATTKLRQYTGIKWLTKRKEIASLKQQIRALDQERARLELSARRGTPPTAPTLNRVQQELSKFTGEGNQQAVRDTAKVLSRILPEHLGDYTFEKVMAIGGNWGITYRKSTERINVQTGEKYRDVVDQSFPMDAEDLLGKSDEELLNIIKERAEKNGIPIQSSTDTAQATRLQILALVGEASSNQEYQDAVRTIYGADVLEELEVLAGNSVISKAPESKQRLAPIFDNTGLELTHEEFDFLWKAFRSFRQNWYEMSPKVRYATVLSMLPASVRGKVEAEVARVMADELNETLDWTIADEDVKAGTVDTREIGMVMQAAQEMMVQDFTEKEAAAQEADRQAKIEQDVAEVLPKQSNVKPEVRVISEFESNLRRLGNTKSFELWLTGEDGYGGFLSEGNNREILESVPGELQEEMWEGNFDRVKALYGIKNVVTEVMAADLVEEPPTVVVADSVTAEEPDLQPYRRLQNGYILTNQRVLNNPGEFQALHKGGPVAVSAMKVQSPTIDHYEFIHNDPATGGIIYRKATNKSSINHDNLETIEKLKDGQMVVFRVDTEYAGDVNSSGYSLDTDTLERGQEPDGFRKYSDDGVRIKDSRDAIDDYPISIHDAETGKRIGWLPRVSWILTQYEGATNYRNIASDSEDKQDNPQAQADRIRAIRRMLAEAHNGNPTLQWEIKTSIIGPQGRGFFPGKVIRAVTISPGKKKISIVQDTVAKHLPDPSIRIGVGAGDAIFFDRWVRETSTPIAGELGLAYAVARDYTGDEIALPLTMPMNTDNEANGAVTAVQAFLDKDQAVAALFQQHQGLNLLSLPGLKDILAQNFTYLSDSDLSELYNERRKNPEAEIPGRFEKMGYLISVTKKGDLQIYRFQSGGDIFLTQNLLQTNKLRSDMAEALRQAVKGRPRHVLMAQGNLKGLSSQGEYKQARYHAGRKFSFDKRYTFPSYQDYIKSIAETAAWGHNKTRDGRYIYTANPQVMLERVTTEPRPLLTEAQETTLLGAAELPASTDLTADEVARHLAFLEGEEYTGYQHRVPDNSLPVTRDMLENLSTLAKNHTGVTVTDMLNYLERQGTGYLAEGYNPFQGCP